MALRDFVVALEIELRLRGVPFERGGLVEFGEDAWPLFEEAFNVGRWTDAFLMGRTVEA
jgi:hypothetical protein